MNSFIDTNIVTKSLVVLMLSFTAGTSLAQSVVSISDEMLNDVSADELYWVVEVTCQGVDQAQTMQQRAGEQDWCAVAMPQMCDENKASMAEQVCSEGYQVLISSSDEPTENNNDTQAVEEPEPEPIVAAPEPVVQEPVVREPVPVVEPDPEPVVSAPVRSEVVAPVIRQAEPEPSPVVSAVTNPEPIEIIESEPIAAPQESPELANQNAGSVLSAEEIAIEEELIRIEEEMLELRLKEIELGQ